VRPSIEAAYAFQASTSLESGTWHLVGDGLIVQSCDVQFDVLTRDAQGDHPVATWTHHFDPPASGFDAQPFEADAPGSAAGVTSGDRLVLRITVLGVSSGTSTFYIPNGDGSFSNGRIPSVTLPK
jgi:hypothetical protein